MRKLIALCSFSWVFFLAGCDSEKIVTKYFEGAGLNRFAAPRTDIQPGAVIIKNGKTALYADNMLDYVKASDENISVPIFSEDGQSQFQAYLKKYDSSQQFMPAKFALGFIGKLLPVSLEGALNFSSDVKIMPMNCKVQRFKVPYLKQFLQKPGMQALKDEIVAQINQGNEVYILYEIWRTDTISITTKDGSDISGGAKLSAPVKVLGTADVSFSIKKTSESTTEIKGSQLYAFAARSAKIVINKNGELEPLVTDWALQVPIKGSNENDKYMRLFNSAENEGLQIAPRIPQ